MLCGLAVVVGNEKLPGQPSIDMDFGITTMSPRIIAACVPSEIHPTNSVDDMPPTRAPCNKNVLISRKISLLTQYQLNFLTLKGISFTV